MDGLNYHYKYPHPSVTTDCVVFGYDGFRLNVLLVERGREPHKGKWAFPGGFLEIDEAAEDGALRELYEETGSSACVMFAVATMRPLRVGLRLTVFRHWLSIMIRC